MSKVEKTLERVLRGNADTNIRFGDLCALLSSHFYPRRGSGDPEPSAPRQQGEGVSGQAGSNVLTSYGLVGDPEAEEPETEEESDEEAGPTATEEKDGG